MRQVGLHRPRPVRGGRTGDDPAVWCFRRFGTSFAELPDGRVVEIAGEYEDFYDPDFCIYNDMVVHRRDDTYDIYGYPEAVFPPTDFHTATLIGDGLFLVGGLGDQGTRRFGTTPVYRLDTRTLAVEPVATTGEPPGWLYGHRARLAGGRIEVSGGKVCAAADDGEAHTDNPYVFLLDLRSVTWSRKREG